MRPDCEKGPQQMTLEISTNIELVEDSIIALAINHISGELFTASQSKIRVYSLLNNSLLADYNIPQFSLQQDQKRMLYKIKMVSPMIFSSGWLVATTIKKQLIYFSKYLMISKPIEIDEQPDMLLVNQREEVASV